MKYILTFSLLALAMGLVMAQSPAGIWKTIDDETGEAKSHIEIYEKDGKMYGKIVKLLKSPQNSVCDLCPGDKKDKPLVGMEIMWDMKKNGNEYSGGKLLKADSGKIYKGKIWVEKGKLMVRGYLGFFYRTQAWERIK